MRADRSVVLALLRGRYEDGDRNVERMRDLAEIVEHPDDPYSLRLDPNERDLVTGYAEWSAVCDVPIPLIEDEEVEVRPLLRELADASMHVLDAACGTGRQATHLHELGRSVVGLDPSAEMVEVARANLPGVIDP